ncbi:MAG TPA: hypothetical protein VIG69_03270, partial [Candidatus Methylomirabilis sp.]
MHRLAGLLGGCPAGIVGLAIALLWAPPAAAHGEHGDVAPALHGRAIVQVAGYEVELLSNPAPPVAGRPAKIVAAVREAGTGRAPTGGRVFIGLAPAGTPEASRPNPSEHASHGSPSSDSAIRNPQSAIPVMVRAGEEGWAGNYTALLRPERKGPHLVRVELRELDGRRIGVSSPHDAAGPHHGSHAGPGGSLAVVTFSVDVAPPPPLVSATMLWVALVAGGAVAGG